MKKLVLTVLAVAGVFFSAQAVLAQQQAAALPVLTSKAYASMKKDDVYVVMFSAAYCGPCRVAKKELFPALIEKYRQDANVHFFMLDVEKDVPAADGTYLKDKWGVEGLPTFAVVYNDTVMYAARGYSAKTAPGIRQNIENKVNALK